MYARSRGGLADLAIALVIVGLLGAGVSVVFPFYAHSRIAGLSTATRTPTLDELVFLSNMLFYGMVAVAVFLAVFAAGLLLLPPRSWRRVLFVSFGVLFLASYLFAVTAFLSRPPTTELLSKAEVLITMRDQIILGTVNPSYVEVIVAVNNTVRWRNDPTSSHSDVIVIADGLFRSPILQPGETWTYTFEKPGRYMFYSPIHPWVKGTVVVKPAG